MTVFDEDGISVRRIPVLIDGQERLQLDISYRLSWDHRGRFLRVLNSHIKVYPAHRTDCLWRFAYLNDPNTKPTAHLHVHAHRDEVVHLMTAGRKSPVRSGRQAQFRYGMADLHFPMGGDRFRPCLEDVLQMLLVEFGIDAEPGAPRALEDGRQRWRHRQVAAATRDDPEAAAAALRDLGYQVTHSNPPIARLEYLRRY